MDWAGCTPQSHLGFDDIVQAGDQRGHPSILCVKREDELTSEVLFAAKSPRFLCFYPPSPSPKKKRGKPPFKITLSLSSPQQKNCRYLFESFLSKFVVHLNPGEPDAARLLGCCFFSGFCAWTCKSKKRRRRNDKNESGFGDCFIENNSQQPATAAILFFCLFLFVFCLFFGCFRLLLFAFICFCLLSFLFLRLQTASEWLPVKIKQMPRVAAVTPWLFPTNITKI